MKPKLPIKFKIGEDVFEPDYMAELEVARETINKNLTEQPGYFAFYAVLSELCEREYRSAKLELELTEAELDSQIREEFREKKERITEAQIVTEIHLQEAYLKAVMKVNEWRKNAGVVKAVREAFAQRKDMLITLASNMRMERDTDVFVKKQEIEGKFETEEKG